MAQLLHNVGPNFVRTYGLLHATAVPYYMSGTNDVKVSFIEKLTGHKKMPLVIPVSAFKKSPYYEHVELKLEPIPLDYLIMEYCPGNMATLSEDIEEVKTSILAQVACALQQAQDDFGFEHNDLGEQNIMLRPTEDKTITYQVRGKERVIQLHGYHAVIIKYSRMTKIPLVGSALEQKHAHLPADPMATPLNTFTDICTLWLSLGPTALNL